MIFILDISDDFYYQLKNRKSIPDKWIVETLLNKYNDLLTIPDTLLFSVTEILLLNLAGNYCEITSKIYNDFLKSSSKNSKKSKHLFMLFKKANVKNIKNREEFYMYIVDNVQNYFENLQFIFFDIYLTNMVVLILINHSNLKGYRLFIEDTDADYEEIDDAIVYLLLALTLLFKFIFLQNSIKISDIVNLEDFKRQ